MNAVKYVVLDLETTGLDPRTDQILEVGAIAVDSTLNEIDRFHRIVSFAGFTLAVDPFVLKMHEKNNLWNECSTPCPSEAQTDSDLAAWLSRVAGRGVILMGNSVHFDHGFIKERFPLSGGLLSHRVMDIGGLARWLTDFGVSTPTPPDMPHRGLLDAEIELEAARKLRDIVRS